jgi:hypothetical protein
MVTAFLSIIISAWIIVLEWTNVGSHRSAVAHSSRSPKYVWMEFLRKNLLAFSDQQLITGIGVQISAYIKICDISLYHLRIIACLGLLSTVTHFLTLILLREYFANRTSLRNLRIAFMAINFILMVNMIVVYLAYNHHTLGLTSPAMCFYRPGGRNRAVGTIMASIFGALGVLLSLGAACFTLTARHMNTVLSFAATWIILPAYIITVLVITPIGLSGAQAITSNKTLVPINPGGSEKEWGFGQILPLLLLLLPLLTALEILSGKIARLISWSMLIRGDEREEMSTGVVLNP